MYGLLGFVGIIGAIGVLSIKRPWLFVIAVASVGCFGISLYLFNIPFVVLTVSLLLVEVYQLGFTSKRRIEEKKQETKEQQSKVATGEKQKNIVHLVEDGIIPKNKFL